MNLTFDIELNRYEVNQGAVYAAGGLVVNGTYYSVTWPANSGLPDFKHFPEMKDVSDEPPSGYLEWPEATFIGVVEAEAAA